MGESVVLMSNNTTVGTDMKTGRYCFPSHVQSGKGYSHLGRAVLSVPYSQIYSREECNFF